MAHVKVRYEIDERVIMTAMIKDKQSMRINHFIALTVKPKRKQRNPSIHPSIEQRKYDHP